MIAKREAEETFVPDGIGEAEVRTTTPKRRRIVVRIDDDDDDDDGVKIEESIERVQPPVVPTFEEEKPPLLTNTDIDDHDNRTIQIESDVNPIQPKRRRVITRASGEETVKKNSPSSELNNLRLFQLQANRNGHAPKKLSISGSELEDSDENPLYTPTMCAQL